MGLPALIENLERLLPFIPISICVLDRDARYLAASHRYALLYNTTLDVMVGKSMVDFCPPTLVAHVLRSFHTFDSGKSVDDHWIVICQRSFHVSVHPIYGQDDQAVVAITVAFHEISALENVGTDQEQAEKASQAYSSLTHLETPRIRNSSEQRGTSDRKITSDSSGKRISPLGARISLRALIQTLIVAEYLSFSHAASALGVSQSSVSARVKALEIELGILLFERNTRGVRLTEAGRHFVKHVAVGIDQLDNAVRSVNQIALGECGNLRIGTHGLIRGSFLDHLLTRYRATHPAIVVEMAEASAREAIMKLRAHKIDIAFLVGKFDLPDCHSRVIWTETLVAALSSSHRLAKHSGVMWSELAEETFLVRHGGTGPQVHDHIVRRLARSWPPPAIQRSNVERDTLLSMVAQGFGVTLLGSASRLFPTPGLVFPSIADEPEPVVFSAVWLPQNRSATLRDLLILADKMGRLT